MGNRSKWALWSLTLGASIVMASVSRAESSKIYLNGQWMEAQVEPSSSAGSHNALFGFGNGPIDLRQIAVNFLKKNATLLGTDHQTAWLSQGPKKSDSLETHRIYKTWNGLPVLGGEALVHLQQGRIAFANADATPLSSLSPTPLLTGEEARKISFSSYRGNALSAADPQLKVLILGDGAQKEARLVYEVTVLDRDQFASDIHFIDANTGEEALVSTNVHTVMDRVVLAGIGDDSDFEVAGDIPLESLWKVIYSDKGCSPRKPGLLWAKGSDALVNAAANSAEALKPCNPSETHILASALSAWTNSGLVYDYFQSAHSRNSLDGQGMQMKSVVNFGGSEFQNAAWYNDKQLMLYGMGDEKVFNDFASPLDVVGHEITHGLTASTADLEYVSEKGALNESYSDVFGKLIAFKNGRNGDWKIGRELFRDGTSFIRDMEKPDVGHTRDFKYRGVPCNRINDFCGVHTNSGIPNKAATILAKRIGLEKLGKLYFLTLSQLLRSSSDFREMRSQTEAACVTLFGQGSSDCTAVSESFASVGM